MDLQTIPGNPASANHYQNQLDANNIPHFDCLCELCDCGCFEKSKQPHSISCKKFRGQQPALSQIIDFKSDSVSSFSSGINSAKAKSGPYGVYSEYQTSYHPNIKEPSKMVPFKLKDTLTFGNKSLNESPYKIDSASSTQPDSTQRLRSKLLNRLSNMIPDGSVSWLNESNKNLPLNGIEPTKSKYNSLNHYKTDYLRKFDESNSGFEDSYSMSKGGVLLQISKNNNSGNQLSKSTMDLSDKSSQNPTIFYNKYLPEAQANPYDPFNKTPVRSHDLRSVWIPKKFEGRNMFASHIDSTIFPDKIGRDPYDPRTAYYQNYDSNENAKKVFEKPPYEKIEKTVRYTMNYANQYVPTIRWLPAKDISHFERPKEKIPVRSSYQADFEHPVQSTPSAVNPNCKSVAVQLMMQHDKRLSERYEKQQKLKMQDIQMRKNVIDQTIANA